MSFNPVELIIKKRNGHTLNKNEIAFMVNNYINGRVPDYQMSAFLMSIFFKGMEMSEIIDLTAAYIESGSQIKFDDSLHTVDKHSTGGVGDKVTIVLAPIVAACGAYVPMISGRGLGHTGGTLDKLEAIPGFKTHYSESEFVQMVEKCGLAIIAQSEKLVPADKKIYALRDVSGTVESRALITASVMCKKIAEGAKNLVIDLKVGAGAFMKNLTEAEALAHSLINTGTAFGQKVKVVFTAMNSPIGYKIGNALEMIECIDYLKGEKVPDLEIITNELACQMLILSNIAKDKNEALSKINEVVSNGKALDKFIEMVNNQGGDPKIVDDYSLFGKSKYRLPIISQEEGFVQSINSQEIGYALVEINAGRRVLESALDYNAGCELYKKQGDRIDKGEIIGYVYCENDEVGRNVVFRILNSMNIAETEEHSEDIIIEVI
ncbi:MAG TPA: thymidine phosphorylase [Candidatus Cloacimonadota bacterium]|jgi:pyrimidine-nucleoside phosphorylase|nr:thymidine phosphorylase [Candidatus Cloacimonadales bacterium]HPY95981.1 thymidine phosphorylase [Candidatus Cloacimonadota bacterium]HQB40587.1 thymidine phosphorylase [Candidatus Cloacimonadota bacterium]